jgi:hypothetical protein
MQTFLKTPDLAEKLTHDKIKDVPNAGWHSLCSTPQPRDGTLHTAFQTVKFVAGNGLYAGFWERRAEVVELADTPS